MLSFPTGFPFCGHLVKCRHLFILTLFLVFIYFIWLHQALVTAPGTFVASCGTFFWSTDSLDEAHKVSSCTTKASLRCCMWDLSSPTRDQTQVPCIARQILNHWVIREVPHIHILKLLSPIQNINLFLLKYALISWPTASTLHVFHLKSFSSYLTSANRKAKPT